MRKLLGVVMLVATMVVPMIGLTGCQAPGAMTLTVTDEEYNGWDPDVTPPPHSERVAAKVGAKVNDSSGVTFEIIAVRSGAVDVLASEPLEGPAVSGSKTYERRVRFTVKEGESLSLRTPTEDGGTNFWLVLTPGAPS